MTGETDVSGHHEMVVAAPAPYDERGASLVEYALLVALIAIVCVVSIAFFGRSMGSRFNTVGSSVTAAGS